LTRVAENDRTKKVAKRLALARANAPTDTSSPPPSGPLPEGTLAPGRSVRNPKKGSTEDIYRVLRMYPEYESKWKEVRTIWKKTSPKHQKQNIKVIRDNMVGIDKTHLIIQSYILTYIISEEGKTEGESLKILKKLIKK